MENNDEIKCININIDALVENIIIIGKDVELKDVEQKITALLKRCIKNVTESDEPYKLNVSDNSNKTKHQE